MDTSTIDISSTPPRDTIHTTDGSMSRSQELTMQLANMDLEWNIFQDPGVLDHIFKIDAVVVDVVFEKVSQTFNLKNPEWGLNTDRRSWNLDEKSERSWYRPLVWFQNHIVTVIKETIDFDPGCIFGELKFCVWDLPLKEGTKAKELGNVGVLKPDILHHRSPTPSSGLSWRDVLLVEEVKGDLRPAILQASTYVRCLFAAHEEWFCIPTLIFEHREAAYYLLFHTRSGIIATLPMPLRTNEGLWEIVKMFICLTRWTPSKALSDCSRSQTRFYFENLGHFRIQEIICQRTNLIGPSTRAYKLARVVEKESRESESRVLSPVEVDEKEPRMRTRNLSTYQSCPKFCTDYRETRHQRRVPPKIVPDPPRTRKRNAPPDPTALINSMPPQRNTRSMAKRQLELTSQVPPNEVQTPETGLSKIQLKSTLHLGLTAPAEWSLVERVDDGPDLHPLLIPGLVDNRESYSELVYKLFTPLDTHCVEGEMFKPLRNELGVPNVIAGFEVRNQENIAIETAAFRSSRAEFWKILLSAEDRLYEWTCPFINRKLYALLMTTVGMPLTKAPTVVHLLEGLLHAMLGHFVLYQSGWLHRDVSTGNVLLLKRPEARNQETVKHVIPPNVTLGDCQGMIIDGDHAVKWKEAREDPGDYRSGTLPFLSMRLLSTWSMALPCRHTAIDDLESFLWVFIISIFECRRMRKCSTTFPDALYLPLYETNIENLHDSKFAFINNLRKNITWARRQNQDSEATVFIAVFDLLEEWHQLAISYADKLDASIDDFSIQDVYAQLSREAYVDYFRAGFGKLAELKAKARVAENSVAW